jgi:hypothetical protein
VVGRYVNNVSKKEGETLPMRNALIADGENLVKDFRNMNTLAEILNKNAQESPEKPFLGTRIKTGVNEKG